MHADSTTNETSSFSLDYIVKQQLDQIAQTLHSKFEESQQSLRETHAKTTNALHDRIGELEKEVKICQQTSQTEKLHSTRLEHILCSRNNKLSHAFYAWKSVGRRVFLSWKEFAYFQKHRQSTTKKRVHQRNQRTLSKCLTQWLTITKSNNSSITQQMHHEKLKIILREVISQYEIKVNHLERELSGARLEIENGIMERKKLEERSRALLLKGMMAMNMDTFRLFSKSDENNSNVDE